MATQISLNDGAIASAGALAIQTNGTTQAVSISTGQVATVAQNPILTSGTANGVAYLNGSKALTTGSALVFDGTNLGVGVTPSAWTRKAIQLGDAAAAYVANNSGGATVIATNMYFDGSNKYATTAASARYSIGTGTHEWYNAASGTADAAITFTQAMTLDASSNLFLGTTTTPTGTGGGRFNVEPGNQNGIAVGVVTTGNAGIDINVNSASAYIGYFRYSGTNVGSITSNGTVTVYNTTSDYRLKTVVGAVSDSGSRIDALQPVEYTWNSNGSRTRGFLAHQFQEVYASSVTGTKDAVDADGKPVYQAMQASTSEVIADLVAELQSLRKRLAAANL